MKIAIISLGCPKNQVDADVFCHALIKKGHATVAYQQEADAIIVNTCGFLDAAKEEAIEYILDACKLKKERPEVKVIVTGCLAERYREEVAKEIPEVDAVVGIGHNVDLPQILMHLERSHWPENGALQCFGPKKELPFSAKRVIGTPAHYAYLKIAEGCSNHCSYCAIPHIRGPMRSRDLHDCVKEAEWLAEQGVREVILVAQDVTAYGMDKGESEIARLLDRLNEVDKLSWIRIMYAYPERITDELIDAMVRNKKVLPYLDLPIQHCNDSILRSMRRKGDKALIQNVISKLRQAMPNIVLRTSLIAGYPGESEQQFEELCEFVKETRFERLGCFAFSREEGTKAAALSGQVPEEERQKRAEILMNLQDRILEEVQNSQIGKKHTVLCDGVDEQVGAWRCRSYMDAPEIDPVVYVDKEAPLKTGAFYEVEIKESDGCDLFGEYVNNLV
ncbi:30S ribosomal protein S12 methylthiotransferase RimO [Ruminococcaceae bacterium OttesenSCG-928-I18]|nr:30S ribosomal protein S12 methylthiotransferase RimO [Ruminococcaceae bacterium OttesenSCG-928-I18]